jgi:peptidoglycan/LPS O-acetylase OafA/YrhL
VALAASFLLSAAAAADLLATPGNRGGLYQNLFFFLAGLHLRPYLERLVGAASRRRAALTGAAYVVALLAMTATAAQQWPLVWPLVCIVAVVFGMTAAGYVSRWRMVGGGLATLGRRTLPIYVIHMPVLALLDWLLLDLESTVDVRWQWVLALVEPAVLTAVVVAVCLVLDAGLRKAGLTWLFDLPSRRTGRAKRSRHTAGGPSPPPSVEPALDGPTVPLPLLIPTPGHPTQPRDF